MSSVDLSEDGVYSSEDEDVVLARMQTSSGLPTKPHSHSTTTQTLKSDTAVAKVTMSGGVMKSGRDLYASSESEEEDIMRSVEETLTSKHLDRSNSQSSRKDTIGRHSVDSWNGFSSSRNASFNSVSAVSDLTLNGVQEKSSDKEAVINGNDSSGAKHDLDLSSSYKDSRFNPFDRDLHIEDDHFEEGKPECNKHTSVGRLKSGKQ